MIRFNRRNFIKSAALPLLMPLTGYARTKSKEQGPVIKSFTVFKTSGNFNRFIAMNAYDNAPKGITGTKSIVTILLSDGTVGIGPVGYRPADDAALKKLKALIGRDPLSFYDWSGNKIMGVKNEMKEYLFDAKTAWFEGAVLDAIGKLRQMPVWKLFGEPVREGIDPYDGTLYFEDIAHNKDVSILAASAKQSKEDGYRAIKMKLGRPLKWMPGEAGVQRDIDAFIAVREAVGTNFKLMADPNNGYDKHFDWAV
ncbi:MAG TPA: enolase C-terminal domain-like protein, partial [Cyclobacteriaceae bacterium]|nr:enolase C-terminal domain-like protein [Cyclobacteriaceae bacterium]